MTVGAGLGQGRGVVRTTASGLRAHSVARLFCTVSEAFILHPVREALLLLSSDHMGLGKTRGLNFRAEKLNFAPSTIPVFCHWSLNWSLNPSSFMKFISGLGVRSG